eukprot:m.107269 g.107269  ORF g.107269 m.107269 type:complete len:538 (-) comp15310_c1_seq5:756-2369(-)
MSKDGPEDSVFLLGSNEESSEDEEYIDDNQAYAKFTLIEGDALDQLEQFVTVKAKASAKRRAVYVYGLLFMALVIGISILASVRKRHPNAVTSSSDDLGVSTLLFTTQPPLINQSTKGQTTSDIFTSLSASKTSPTTSSATSSQQTANETTSRPLIITSRQQTSSTTPAVATTTIQVQTPSLATPTPQQRTTSSPEQTSADQTTTIDLKAHVCHSIKASKPGKPRPQPAYRQCAEHAMLNQSYLCRATPVSPSALNIVVVGDFGRDGMCCQVDVALEMALASAKLDADLIISTGDNFYPSGLQFVGDLQSKTSFSNVYTSLQPLQKDWYAVLGNHDVRGSVEAQLSLNVNDSFWNMPSRYYTKTFETNSVSVQFIFIDTNLMLVGLESNNTHQLAWLNETLDKSTADWIIMVGHHPVITAGTHKKELIKQKNADRPSSYVADYLLPLFDKYNVAAYFCGHDHDLQHLQVANISTQLFVTGAGSMIRDPLEYANETAELVQGFGLQGYMTASLNATHMQVQMLDYVGVLHYTYLIPRL